MEKSPIRNNAFNKFFTDMFSSFPDEIPKKFSKEITPIINMSPLDRATDIKIKTVALPGNFDIFTTHPTKLTFIKSVFLSVISNTQLTTDLFAINVMKEGIVNKTLIGFPVRGFRTRGIKLNCHSLLVDKNTTIQLQTISGTTDLVTAMIYITELDPESYENEETTIKQ